MESTIKIHGQVKQECYTSTFLDRLILKFLPEKYKIPYLKKYGTLKWEEDWIDNGTTNAGKALFSSRMGSSASAVIGYIAVGSTNTAFSASQTTLVSEISTNGFSRAAATFSQDSTGGVSNDTAVFSKTFTATGSSTIEEVGLFNASSGGTMSNRALTGSKAFVNTDIYAVTYKVTFS